MLQVPTALLLHTTATGRHHDWLLGTPAFYREPGSGLWTARVGPASRDWRAAGRFTLTELPPHRRTYLDYQGAVSRGRGTVVRVDRGVAVPRLWSRSRIVWALRMRGFAGVIEARRVHGPLWLARVII